MGWLRDAVYNLAARLHVAAANGADERGSVRLLAVMPFSPDRLVLSQIADRSNWTIEFASNCESAVKKLRAQKFGIILCDRDLCGGDWRDSMEVLVANAPKTCVILTSQVNDDYLWQEVIQRGGYDVLTKPFQEERVQHTIDQAWSYWRSDWRQPISRRSVS